MGISDMSEPSKKDDKIFGIEVNRKPVGMIGKFHTGLQIKEAAIKEGVKIKLDFFLVERKGNQSIPIADDQVVELHEDMKFRANDGEDNS
jgi:hypothetical protein